MTEVQDEVSPATAKPAPRSVAPVGPAPVQAQPTASVARASSRQKPRHRWLLVALVVLLLGGGAVAYFATHRTTTGGNFATGTFFTVVPTEMDIKISKDGELQAVNNIDIVCHVEGLNTISTIVPEGTFVQQGDVLVTIDSASIRHKLEDSTAALETSKANLVTANEMKQIQESQNAANVEAAELTVTLAKLDLKGYNEGTYPQQLKDATVGVTMAELTLKNAEDDLNNTKNLFIKGFVTPSDVKKSELAVTTAQNALDKAKTALEVLTNYTHKSDLVTKETAVAQAEQRLLRTKNENAANLSLKQANVRAAETALRIIQRQFEDQNEQLSNCTIKAPAAGLVIYSSTFDRSMVNPIQEGATVRDKQLLMRLPDVSALKAIVRIAEAAKSRLRADEQNPMRAMVRIVRSPKPIEVGAWVSKISVLADSTMRYFNPDLKEYPVDLTLDWTPKDVKPGESVRAEIYADHLSNVLAVPLDAIYSAGTDNYVFIHNGEDVTPVMVTLGESNDTHAEVRKGLSAGQQVLRLQAGQGRLLAEKKGVKAGATTRPSGRFAKHGPVGLAPKASAR